MWEGPGPWASSATGGSAVVAAPWASPCKSEGGGVGRQPRFPRQSYVCKPDASLQGCGASGYPHGGYAGGLVLQQTTTGGTCHDKWTVQQMRTCRRAALTSTHSSSSASPSSKPRLAGVASGGTRWPSKASRTASAPNQNLERRRGPIYPVSRPNIAGRFPAQQDAAAACCGAASVQQSGKAHARRLLQPCQPLAILH